MGPARVDRRLCLVSPSEFRTLRLRPRLLPTRLFWRLALSLFSEKLGVFGLGRLISVSSVGGWPRSNLQW